MRDDPLDELLDRALTSYSGAQPLAGLDERVLARAGCLPENRLALGRWIGLGVAVLLGIWFAGVHGGKTGERVVIQKVQQASVVPTVAPPTVHVTRVSRKRSNKPIAAKLSEEELLLARYVLANPDDAEKAFSTAREPVERDLMIEPLSVKPIKVESLQ